MARIWHLKRPGVDIDYNEAAEMVVIADTEDDARVFASRMSGDEAGATWLTPMLCTCQSIGSANESVTAGVICRDYRAG